MTLFVDTSMYYAAADRGDRSHSRAAAIMRSGDLLATSDHVVVETWLMLRGRLGKVTADRWWSALGAGAHVEMVTEGDLVQAMALGQAFQDQDFSIVDRTSFAVMIRLGLARAASLDDDFAIFRYGPRRERAFEVVR